MTGENLRANVADEVANAERLLRAADALVAIGCGPDAVNRAYYAVFHLTVAMLLVIGQEPRSHAGAKSLLGSALVRPGRVPARLAVVFADLEQQRLASDYERFVEVSDEEARRALAAARDFSGVATAFLTAQGF